MLKANLGVTALPSLAIPSDPDLVSIPLTAPVETRQICLITRKKSVLSPAADAMIELLTQETPRLADELCLTLGDQEGCRALSPAGFRPLAHGALYKYGAAGAQATAVRAAMACRE
jgi:hypothetical protein